MFASARGLMSSSFAILVVVTFVWLQCGARAMPAADEDRYIDKEYSRDVSGWLADLAAASAAQPAPCHPNYNGYFNPSKRNSELINSLLSLPKTMNDAGKK